MSARSILDTQFQLIDIVTRPTKLSIAEVDEHLVLGTDFIGWRVVRPMWLALPVCTASLG